ncbi:class I SAM-dependent methyltransferase [Natronospora cellulosivora (SeqCode)]
MKNIKEFYNTTARDWANKWYEDDSLLPYLREFFNYLPKNPKVLDLCCGAGYESMRMKKMGAIVTGLDFSEESILIAKERNPDIKFVVEDMLNDYSYLGKYDGCAVIAGLIHLPNEKLTVAFDMIHKILNDYGYLFVVVKEGTGKNTKLSFTTIDGEEYDRCFYMHTIDELKNYSKNKFSLEKEIILEPDLQWKYYIFKSL